MYPNWGQIVTGVQHGDILIFRGWFGDHLNTRVQQAWTEADFSSKELTTAVRSAGEDVRKLAALLSDTDALVQYQAATQLARTPGPEAIAQLITTLQSQSPWIVRRAVSQALGKIGGAEAIAALTQSMNKPKSDLQYFAAIALGDCGSDALPALSAALDSTDHQRWEAVAAALVRISGPAPEPVMLRVLKETKPFAMQARRVVLANLKNQPRPSLLDAVIALLSVGDDTDRTRVAQTLGAYKNHRAIEHLLKVLDDPSKDLYQTKKAAMFALEDITGRDSSSKDKTGGGENAAIWRKLLSTGTKP
jgi:HEAT repeat protein